MAKGFDAFVILAEMRTGSNALEERLNDYEGLDSHGEVFNPHFVGAPKRDRLFGIGIRARDTDPIKMLEALKENSTGLAGFRLFSDHDPRVIEHCLSERRIAKVILTRNLLDSYVSLKIARATGQWWLSDLSRRKEATAQFDAGEFDEFAARRTAHLKGIRHRLQVTGQTAFEVAYEDLGDDDVIRGCARFLGARKLREEAGPRGRVQNPVPLSEKVSNFVEMKAALAARDPFDTDHHPDFEPAKGPNVPAFLAARTAPLLFLPVKGAADDRVSEWLGRLGGGGPAEAGFTRKTVRAWKRRHGPHLSFTVVAHPVARAHAAFCTYILSRGEGSFTGIRATLARSYGVPLPEDPADPGYDAKAHGAAFLAFLRFLKGNLAGQTAIRVDSAWASQTALVQGMSGFVLPDRICRAEALQAELDRVAQAVGIAPAPVADAGPEPFPLAEIYSDRIERAARRAYQRDYMMFGYGAWKAQ